jgi:hypothetical protein
MSKTTVAGLLVGAIILITGAYLGYVGYGSQKKESLSMDKEILLYTNDGEVMYKNPGDVTFQKTKASPTAVLTGSQVVTKQGHATILFPDNSSVDLDTNTSLTLTYSDKKIFLYQTLGNTYHRVEALVNGSTYQVETPNTLAAVRGTKFAVTFNKETNETKIAVTEHKVQVSTTVESPTIATSTITLEEGKTVRVDASKTGTSTTTANGQFFVTDTTKDKEISSWVERNKERDTKMEELKSKNQNKEDIRAEFEKVLQSDSAENVDTKADSAHLEGQVEESLVSKRDSAKEVVQKEAARKDESPKPAVTQREVKTPVEIKPSTTIVKKLDEEVFFDKFNTLFINNFYLDEKDGACDITNTPDERVRTVTLYATESGYPFSSKTLLSFATAIDTYCKHKDPAVKAKLQAQFDVELPFQDSI